MQSGAGGTIVETSAAKETRLERLATIARLEPGADVRRPSALDRRFEAVVVDWDATAMGGAGLRALFEELCACGLDLIVITDIDVGAIDGQLGARPAGPGRLFLCVDRGTEVFEASRDGLELRYRREATSLEEAALDAAAAATLAQLGRRGLAPTAASQRAGRRKIGLFPEPESDGAPRAQQERLRGGVEIATAAAREAGLAEARVTSHDRHVEIGVVDKSDALRWALAELARRGIGAGLVLVVGGELAQSGNHSPLLVAGSRATVVSLADDSNGIPADVLVVGGGSSAFRSVLVDQLERRRRRDVPELEDDPDWTLVVEGADPELERVQESLLTLADGRLGTRGAPLHDHASDARGVLFSGVYAGDGAGTELAPCPDWTRVAASPWTQPQVVRRLDLATGLLHEEGRVTSLRFSSLARPGTVALRASAQPQLLASRRPPRGGAAVGVAWRDRRRGNVFERIGAYDPEESVARSALADAQGAGFERLLREQREAWARRWQEADVVVEGDAELQRAIRFALFHLMASVADDGEAGVGARGLSGPAYRGHVFWDSDVFVLPFLAATHPAAARAMLEYRVRRLPAARAAASRLGRSGARFAWESAADGRDVTPASVRLPNGGLVRIRTGELEEHIVGDVAWAAACYLDWTGDAEFAAGPGRELLVETARYWASRVRREGDGRAHIYGVIGPDEYHEPVDDNAFTNVLARWNLRRAAALEGVDERERSSWLAIAEALVDGYDRASGVYEQFAGFFDLEPLVIEEIAPHRPIAADVLLGAERTRGAQVIKQADVLMLHHLLPDEVARDSLGPNLDFYEPRTAHGSSLSPAVTASVLARAGRYRPALEALRIAARMDLDDLNGSTAGGLHLATMGGLWQALAFGFAGIRPCGDRLLVEPRLPTEWNALEFGLRFRGAPLRLRVDRGGVTASPAAWTVRQADNRWEVLPPLLLRR